MPNNIYGSKAGHQEEDKNIKLEKLVYLLNKTLPLLRNIQHEQNSELEVETNIWGIVILSDYIFYVSVSLLDRWKKFLSMYLFCSFHRYSIDRR